MNEYVKAVIYVLIKYFIQKLWIYPTILDDISFWICFL